MNTRCENPGMPPGQNSHYKGDGIGSIKKLILNNAVAKKKKNCIRKRKTEDEDYTSSSATV